MNQNKLVSLNDVLQIIDYRIDLVSTFWKNADSSSPKKQCLQFEIARLKGMRSIIAKLPNREVEAWLDEQR